jgi:hypothetical protein
MAKKYDTKYIPFAEVKKLSKLNDWGIKWRNRVLIGGLLYSLYLY